MKISIITVAFNAEKTIGDTLRSVALQTYDDVEHIVIDGASTDGTLRIISQYKKGLAHVVSEPDSGIYEAMNKGIKLASGDVIGLLNSDDVYHDHSVLQQVADAHGDPYIDACYADLIYVRANDLNKITRYWRSRKYRQGLCFKGWMPAHPTFYAKRRVYEKIGLYNEGLKYQADLEFCARAFELQQITSRYIPQLWVRMRLGGVTNGSIRTILAGNWESYKALRELGLKRDPVSYFAIKFGSKLSQFIKRS